MAAVALGNAHKTITEFHIVVAPTHEGGVAGVRQRPVCSGGTKKEISRARA
jgi:hypothetical protein